MNRIEKQFLQALLLIRSQFPYRFSQIKFFFFLIVTSTSKSDFSLCLMATYNCMFCMFNS